MCPLSSNLTWVEKVSPPQERQTLEGMPLVLRDSITLHSFQVKTFVQLLDDRMDSRSRAEVHGWFAIHLHTFF